MLHVKNIINHVAIQPAQSDSTGADIESKTVRRRKLVNVVYEDRLSSCGYVVLT